MIPPPPRSTRPDPLLPYTPLFRSAVSSAAKLEHVMFKSIVILLLAAVVSACSSNTPSNNDISAAFRATELPGLLELESFAVESPRNIGSKDDPTWLARYTADVATREDTFELDTVTDGTRPPKPVHRKEE